MNLFDLQERAIVIALILIVASAALGAKSGQDKPKDSESPKKGLQLSAQVDRELYKPTSVISLKLKLENTSKSTTYIYKELGFGPAGFRITILDADNRWVPPRTIAEQFPSPVLSKDDLQAIDPGKSIEETITLRLLDYEIRPGDYTLKTKYISPVAVDAVPGGLTVLTSSDGPLEAKPIRFKVLVPSPE